MTDTVLRTVLTADSRKLVDAFAKSSAAADESSDKIKSDYSSMGQKLRSIFARFDTDQDQSGQKARNFSLLAGTSANEVAAHLDDVKESADKASGEDGGEGMSGLTKAALLVGPALAPIGSVAAGLAIGLGGIGVAAAAGFEAFKAAGGAALTSFEAQASAMKSAWAGSMQQFVAPVFTSALKLLPQVFSDLTPIVQGASAGLQVFVKDLGALLNNPATTAFFKSFGGEVQKIFTNLGPIIVNVGKAFMSAFSAAEPLINSVLGILQSLTGSLARINFGKVLAPLIRDFNTFAPVVGGFLKSLFQIVGQVLQALSPIGAVILKVLSSGIKAAVPILRVLNKVIQAVAPVVLKLAGALGGVLVRAVSALAPIIGALAPIVVMLAKTIGGALINSVKTVGPLILGLAKPIVALFKGIAAGLGPAVKGFAGLTNEMTPLTYAFEPLAKALGKMGPLFGEIGRTIGQLAGPLAKLAGLVLGFGATLLEDLVPNLVQIAKTVIAGVLPAFKVLVPLIGAISPIVSSLVAALSSALKPVLAAVGDTLKALLPVLGSVIRALGPALQSIVGSLGKLLLVLIKEGVSPLLKALLPLLPVIGQLLGSVVQLLPPIAELVAGLLSGLMPILTPLIDLVGGLARILADVLAGAIGDVVVPILRGLVDVLSGVLGFVAHFGTNISKVWHDISHVTSEVWHGITGIFKRFWPELLALATGGLSLIAGLIVRHWHAVESTTMNVFHHIEDFFKDVWHDIENVVLGAVHKVEHIVTDAWDALGRGTREAWDRVLGFLKEIPGDIVYTFKRLGADMLHIGEDIIKGLWHGIESMAGWLKSKVEGVAHGIVHMFTDPLSIFSPSRVMSEQVGKPIIQGVAAGIQAETNRSLKAAVNAAQKSVATGWTTPKVSTPTGSNTALNSLASLGYGGSQGGRQMTNNITINAANSPEAISEALTARLKVLA